MRFRRLAQQLQPACLLPSGLGAARALGEAALGQAAALRDQGHDLGQYGVVIAPGLPAGPLRLRQGG